MTRANENGFIDWISAPEDATHHSPSNDERPWRMEDDGLWYGWDPEEEAWVEIEDPEPDTYTLRPEFWNGEDIPPAGSLCEWGDDHRGWVTAQVLASHNGYAWIITESSGYRTVSSRISLRAIKTSEQIEAAEKAAFCIEAQASMDIPYLVAEKLWREGYRKADAPTSD